MLRIGRSLILFFIFVAAPAAQAQESIGVGETIEAELADNAAAEYRFIGEPGQYITISLDSDDFDAYVRLLDANQEQIAADDDSGGNLNSKIGPIRLEAGGVYTIVAASLDGFSTGAYTLRVLSASANRIDYRQPVTGELSEAEPSTIYVFAAKAGDVISIEMNSDDFDSYLTLDAENPRRNLMADDDSGVGFNARIGPYVIPEAGEYSITASRLYSTATGSYTLHPESGHGGANHHGHLAGSHHSRQPAVVLHVYRRGQPDHQHPCQFQQHAGYHADPGGADFLGDCL